MMSEDAAVEEVQNDENDSELAPPSKKDWWQFESREQAVEWANDKIQKRLAREKSKYEPILEEHGKLKLRVEQLEPFEQAQKTDSQRWESERENLSKELEDLRNFRKTAERNDLVREIAEDKGLPSRFISRVRGDDADSITADVEELLTVLNDGKPAKPASRKPKEADERPSSKGYGGGGSDAENDDDAVVANVVKKNRENRNRSFVR